MINKSLIERLFTAFSIERWNDQIRPTPLVEMDKHAHKMAIAYCLARSDEDTKRKRLRGLVWHNIIRGGIFELLRRCVLSDIKSPIYREIKSQHPDHFKKLSKWVFQQLEPEVGQGEICNEMKRYLVKDNLLDERSKRILEAAHIYASHWEFQIISRTTPDGEEAQQISNATVLQLAQYEKLPGMGDILERDPPAAFLDVLGKLRFQIRWGQTPRMPRTSVLGHSMMVASLAYLMTREVRSPRACNRRLRNNFFGGLFHDLPEAVTRDIISPVKGAVPGLSRIIGRMEKKLVREIIYPLLDPKWIKEFRYFTEDEFMCKIIRRGKIIKLGSSDISRENNKDHFQPYDGRLIEAADHLAGLAEAKMSGIQTTELQKGAIQLGGKHKNERIAGVDIGSIFANWN